MRSINVATVVTITGDPQMGRYLGEVDLFFVV